MNEIEFKLFFENCYWYTYYRIIKRNVWFIHLPSCYECALCKATFLELTEMCPNCCRTILHENDYHDYFNSTFDYFCKNLPKAQNLIKEANLVEIVTPEYVIRREWHNLSPENLKNIVLLEKNEEILNNHATQINNDAIDRINNTVYHSVSVGIGISR